MPALRSRLTEPHARHISNLEISKSGHRKQLNAITTTNSSNKIKRTSECSLDTLHWERIYQLRHVPRQRALASKDALHLPTSNPHPTLQLPRLVEPTASSPPHRRHRLLRQDRARLLAHQLRTAVHHRRRPQALHPLMRLETQQCRRERASNRQLRRERWDLAAMGRGRWEGRGCARGGFHEWVSGR